MYFADRLHHVVRKITADGFIARAAGTGSVGFSGDGGPPLQARLSFPQDVSVAKDGALFIADAANYRIRRSHVPLPGFTDADITLPSEDGGELYQFNQNGRHLRTVDAITGAVVYEFGYSATGRLTTITDGYGNVTTIQRDAAGNATAIVAPGGQQTTLTEDASGSSRVVRRPGRRHHADDVLERRSARVAHRSGGRRRALRLRLPRSPDPRRGRHSAQRSRYARVDTPRGFEVATTSPSGLISVYEVEHLPSGDVRSTATTPSGAQSVMVFAQDGTTTITTAEGASVEATAGPDPRWGMAAPLLTKLVRATPSGLTDTVTRSRTVVAHQSGRPVQHRHAGRHAHGERSRMDEDVCRRHAHADDELAGRKARDAGLQRPRRDRARRVPNRQRAARSTTYDTHGRLASVQRGTQKLTYAYDDANRLIGRTDALGKATKSGVGPGRPSQRTHVAQRPQVPVRLRRQRQAHVDHHAERRDPLPGA